MAGCAEPIVQLSWALCISTLNRADILEKCVRLALSQTFPPKEIIIVDASENWIDSSRRISVLNSWEDVLLTYHYSEIKSLTRQRNIALALATADILFFFDDDTLMYPTCASEIMHIYQIDKNGAISSVGATPTSRPPCQEIAQEIPTKAIGFGKFNRFAGSMFPPVVVRFFYKEILLLDIERRFVPYDAVRYPRHPELEKGFSDAGAFAVRLISGFRITVRRKVAQEEPFDEVLLAYCPAEDLDATYRYLRHGINVQSAKALVYHHEAASGRLKRRRVAELALLNISYFVRRRGKHPVVHRLLFHLLSLRLLFSCALRDTLSRRWDYPDTIGCAAATLKSFSVFRIARDELEETYTEMQREILSR
jgi:glycosyltransferase involved in cell wall biosynthesis